MFVLKSTHKELQADYAAAITELVELRARMEGSDQAVRDLTQIVTEQTEQLESDAVQMQRAAAVVNGLNADLSFVTNSTKWNMQFDEFIDDVGIFEPGQVDCVRNDALKVLREKYDDGVDFDHVIDLDAAAALDNLSLVNTISALEALVGHYEEQIEELEKQVAGLTEADPDIKCAWADCEGIANCEDCK